MARMADDWLDLLARSRRLAAENRLEEALAILDSLRRHWPGRSAGLEGLRATILRELGDPEAAACALAAAGRGGDLVRRALVVSPIMRSVAAIEADRRRVVARLTELERVAPAIADPLAELRWLDFYLAFHGRDDRPIRERLARVLRKACPQLAFTAPHCERWSFSGLPSRRRVRVGFLSSHFTEHTIARLNQGLIESLDRSRWRPLLLFAGERPDARTAALRRAAGESVDLPRDLQAARERIAALELDILYYPDVGMDPFTYLLAFARLAPVQCATWGHPVTTGLETIDWFVSGAFLEPPGSELLYTERLYRMPDPTVRYAPPPAPPESRRLDLLESARGRRLYVCPQSLFKLHPEFDAILVAILRRDPRGELVLLEPRRPRWREMFVERLAGEAPEVVNRIRFLPPLGREDYLALLRAADVMLDPLHFGGGHTSLEGLAMGAPIVTLPSRLLRGRLTAAWYRVLGVEDLVARSPDHYVRLALEVAASPATRENFRRKLAARRDRLFDHRGAVEAHERFFEYALAWAATCRPPKLRARPVPRPCRRRRFSSSPAS